MAHWNLGKKVLDVLKNAATRAARRAPEDTSCEALFDDCTEAHNELHRRRDYSPFQLLFVRSPPGLPLDGDKQLGEVSASLTSDGRHRLHIQRECHRAYLDEEMRLQQRRREIHKSRPFRVWSSGEWCWFWRSRAHLHRRPRPVGSLRMARSWVQHVYFCKNGSGRETTSNTKLWCGSWMETNWYVALQLIFAVVYSRTNAVLAERWGSSDLSTIGTGTPETQLRGSCRTALTNRGRFRRTDGRGI